MLFRSLEPGGPSRVNHLSLVKTIARLRGLPFAVSTIAAPEDHLDAGDIGTG